MVSGVESGPLASYLTSLWGAYGLTRLRSLYYGPAIRVRESGGNTEQDIGFVGDGLDTSTLASFCGANDGFIVKWYDQSGHGNDLGQSASGYQPQIVFAGTYAGALFWDGSDDRLYTANSSGTTTKYSILLHCKPRYGAGDQSTGFNEVLFHNAGQDSVTLLRTATLANDGTRTRIYEDISNYGDWNERPGGVGQTSLFVFDDTKASIAAGELEQYIGGTLTTAATGSANTSGNYTSGAWYLGMSAAAASPCRMACGTMLIWEASQAANAAALDSALASLWSYWNYDCLDSYTSNLWGVYSLRRQISSYAGSAIRVRRSSDNTEQDIGFSSGELDTASLTSFVGANNAYVTKWYDQSGAGNDLAQSTQANQPRIVSSGVVDKYDNKPAVYFDGSNDHLGTSATTGTTNKYTAYFRARVTSPSVQGTMMEHSTSASSNNSFLVRNAAAAGQWSVYTHQNSSAGVAWSYFGVQPSGGVLCAVLDRSQATKAAMCAGYTGGVALTRTGNNDSGVVPSGNYDDKAIYIGARSGGTLPYTGYMETVALYNGVAHSAATVEAISRALM